MRVSDFDFDLPEDLIAQVPLPERAASRLLVVDPAQDGFADRRFADLAALLSAGDLLVLNDTRVIPARLRGRKAGGGRIELLLERITGTHTATVQLRASRAPAAGAQLSFPGDAVAAVEGRRGDFFALRFDRPLAEYFAVHGEVPLPPYIKRPPAADDAERYQTVYAKQPGAVAAPTAGLHIDRSVLDELSRRSIAHDFLTLHVGAGTFAPLRSDQVERHRLHSEYVEVSAELCARIEATRAAGGRVVAVGTTTVRALESAARDGRLRPHRGETSLFIYPGFEFHVVDAMVTNFHLPRSSLLMLVAAFAGRERVLAAYRHAIGRRYRFFSYGDAMLLVSKAGERESGS
jgi:S-adenosylmethionine:tRNA ribosyltransferase-isomerase